MYLIYLILLTIVFALSWYLADYQLSHDLLEGSLSDWVSLLLANKYALLINFVLPILIIFLLHLVMNKALYVIKKRSRVSSFEFWKAASLLIIIFDIYIYIILELKWLIALPIFLYVAYKELFIKKQL